MTDEGITLKEWLRGLTPGSEAYQRAYEQFFDLTPPPSDPEEARRHRIRQIADTLEFEE